MATINAKARRMSVQVDMQTRVNALADAATTLVQADPTSAVHGRATIVEFLNATRVAVNMHSKTEDLRERLERLVATRMSNDMSTFVPSTIARASQLLHDEYVRAVGIFGAGLSYDELAARVAAVPGRVLQDTAALVHAAAAFSNTAFHRTAGASHDAGAFAAALAAVDPSIPLLEHVDGAKLRRLLAQLGPGDVADVLRAMRQCLPRVHERAPWFKPGDDASAVVRLFGCHRALLRELQGGRTPASRLPTSTPLFAVVDDATQRELVDVCRYLREASRAEQYRATIDTLLALCQAVIRAHAVLAVFRTILFAQELQHARLDWCLLDLPDRRGLNDYIVSLAL